MEGEEETAVEKCGGGEWGKSGLLASRKDEVHLVEGVRPVRTG